MNENYKQYRKITEILDRWTDSYYNEGFWPDLLVSKRRWRRGSCGIEIVLELENDEFIFPNIYVHVITDEEIIKYIGTYEQVLYWLQEYLIEPYDTYPIIRYVENYFKIVEVFSRK